MGSRMETEEIDLERGREREVRKEGEGCVWNRYMDLVEIS